MIKYVVLLLIVVSCSQPPSPPTPPGPGPTPPSPGPVMDFTVNGKTMTISGKLKPGARVTLEESKRSMKTAIDLVDK